MTNEKHMIIHCWSWGHWFYKKNKYSLTLYFPDCSVFFSCSHRTTLMSSFEPFLVCHFPRSSEVAAAKMACIKVKMAGWHGSNCIWKNNHEISIHLSGIISRIFSYLSSVENIFWERSNFVSKKRSRTSEYDLLHHKLSR